MLIPAHLQTPLTLTGRRWTRENGNFPTHGLGRFQDQDLAPWTLPQMRTGTWESAKSKWPHLLIEICPQQRTTFCQAQWFTPVFPQETQAARLRPVWTPQWTMSEKFSPLSFTKIILQGHISNYNTKSSLCFHGCHFLRVNLMSRGKGSCILLSAQLLPTPLPPEWGPGQTLCTLWVTDGKKRSTRRLGALPKASNNTG